MKDNKRCEHWFDWKDCIHCGTKNDIVSRQCRSCKGELIDPNRKLKEKAFNQERFTFDVDKTEYLLTVANGYPLFMIRYYIKGKWGYFSRKTIQERFSLGSEKSRNYFYHTVVKNQFKDKASKDDLQNMEYLKYIIQQNLLYSPSKIECINKEDKTLKVVKKHFAHLGC